MSDDEIHESTEPDLHVPGKPRWALVTMPDGSRSVYPLPRTKWDNCMSLTHEVKSRKLTVADLTWWQLTRREYEHFLAVYAQSHTRTETLPGDLKPGSMIGAWRSGSSAKLGTKPYCGR